MGLFELITNAIEHGNLKITSEEKTKLRKEDRWLEEIDRRLTLPENQDKYVDIVVTRQSLNKTQDKATDNNLAVQIIDQGPGFNWKKYETDSEDNKNINLKEHGRGIFMAKALAFKKLTYSESGNMVTAIIQMTNNPPEK